MPKFRFTSGAISKLKPDGTQVDYFDTGCPGLGLRLGPGGSRTFFVRYRFSGKQKRLNLGRFSAVEGAGIGLADARSEAGRVLELAQNDVDPAIEKKRTKQVEADRKANTFDAVADEYITRHAKVRKRTWKEDQRILNAYFKPEWGDRPISDITRADVVRVLDSVEERGVVMANRSLAVIRKLFNWAMDERALIDAVPVGRNMARGVEKPRQRALSDEEIKSIWKACEKIGGVKGGAVKLLLLTGQRRGVVAGMLWSELKDDLWLIPGDQAGRAKNKLDHVVPLPRQALAVLDDVGRRSDTDSVFGRRMKRGDVAINLGSKLKAEFDEACGFDDWRWNDIRAVVATRMKNPLGISGDVINRVQGRLDQSVLARHYDRHDYLEEKRSALQTWANYLEALVAGEKSNVVRMNQAAKQSKTQN